VELKFWSLTGIMNWVESCTVMKKTRIWCVVCVCMCVCVCVCLPGGVYQYFPFEYVTLEECINNLNGNIKSPVAYMK
jgi:hypothetical protein